MSRSAGILHGVRPHLLLTALCLLLYLPGIAAIPPLDRDEARFAQATRQMLQTGDFLRIRFQGEARNKKPAGIYWLQAASVSLFSTPEATAIWPYRVPSLLGATAAMLLTFVLGRALFRASREPPISQRIGVSAAVLLASALGVVAEAHIAKTDAALLAAAVGAQLALGLAYVRARAGHPVALWIPIAFWAAEIAAILLKGPVGPLLALVTAATLGIADRDLRWLRGLRPLAGMATLVVVVAPWLIAIESATEGRFLADSLGHDMLSKLVGGQESHGAPPLSYLLLAPVTFWPGSLLLVPALVGAWRRHRRAPERFLLAWLLPSWILLELVPTKLPHYVLPLFPALALLVAAVLVDEAAPLPRWARRVDVGVRGIWFAVTATLAGLLVGAPLRFSGQISIVGVLGAGLVLAIAAALLRYRPGPGATTVLLAALSFVFVAPAAQAVVPRLDRLWLSREAADLVARNPRAATPIVAVGYREPSLVFLIGTDLRLATAGGAAEQLAGGGEALVASRADAMFRLALGARGLLARPVGSVRGLDYSNGEPMVLTLYDVAPGREGVSSDDKAVR